MKDHVYQALNTATQRLAQAGVDSPRLAAELLLAHSLGISRSALLARLDWPWAHLAHEAGQAAPADHPAGLLTFQTGLERCAGGEPLAYIVGHKAFYDLDFVCDDRALIPRPETELLVEAVLAFQPRFPAPGVGIADVGAGSGCIAVTLAAHWPAARLYAIDVSPTALALARHNAERNAVGDRVVFLSGDLLSPLPEPVHIIVANLPYVTSAEWANLPDFIRLHEPRLALDGGADGLDLVRRLLDQAPTHLAPGGLLALEIGATQGQAVLRLARAAFPAARLDLRPDYAGLDRLVIIQIT